MNFRIVLSLFCFSLAVANAQVPVPGSEGKTPLAWAADYVSALKQAETEKKPLVIDVSTDWCGWSKKMERETFANSGVQEYLKTCVLLRVNPEASDANRTLAEQYDATGYPTLIVANYKGEALAIQDGYQDAEKFTKYLKNNLAGFKNNPLGYAPAQLAADDPLMKAIARMPKTNTLPTGTASIILLDQADTKLAADATATSVTRTAYYVVDPDQGPSPSVHINYNSSHEKVKLKSVRILDIQGKGRNANVELAEDEHAYSNQNVYWDVRNITLDVPPLKAGQILDIVEERESKPVMAGHHYQRWMTASTIIAMGDLTITFPEKLGLQKQSVRCPTAVTETKNPDGTITWKLATQNLDEPEPEMYSPMFFETWQGYEFSTPLQWNDVASWFTGLCEGRDTLPTEAKTRVADLKKANSDPTALLQAIMDWVTKDIRYVGVHFGQSSHQPHPVADTFTNRYGDCKDQSLLVMALCREVGIPASLVLVGTGYGHQFDAPTASINRFDHCIVEARVGDKLIYLDPAAGPSKIGRLSIECSAVQALRVNGKTGEVITLPAYVPMEQDKLNKTVVKLNPNGSATVTEIHEVHGIEARTVKLSMRRNPPEKIRKSLEEAYKKQGQKLLEFTVTDPNDESENFKSVLSFTLPRFASRSSEGLVFKLGSTSEQGQDWTAALEAPRNRPFHFYPSDPSVTIYEIEVPEGASLKSKPEDLDLNTSFMHASRKISVQGNKLTLAESSVLKDAKLPSTEAPNILAQLRKLQDHRETIFIVTLPAATSTSPPAASPAAATPSKT